MNALFRISLSCVIFIFLLVGIALAEPLLPEGANPDLDQQMARHAKQFYQFNAYPFGMSLDVHPKGEAEKALISDFLAQDEIDDFQTFSGSHAFDVLQSFGEYGDLGFFGGVALVGTAHAYMHLKNSGADESLLSVWRTRVVRAAEALHIFYVIPGGNGVVARGVRRLKPENPEDPPIPFTDGQRQQNEFPIPLADEQGNPLPAPKDNGTYRADNSGGILPEGEWGWKDSCSKDQLVGQVFAMTALYDAMKDDPNIDQSLVTRLQDDALGVAHMLMEMRDISLLETPSGTGMYDLIIMDADGRATFYHDLNPFSLEKIYMEPGGLFNVFNTVMAIGVMKGLFHITGDSEVEDYLYRDLLGERDFLGLLQQSLDGSTNAFDYMYQGVNTNFDVPDMSAVALYLGLYFEKDPEAATVLSEFMESAWWQAADEPHTARLAKQPFWHALYLGMTANGTDGPILQELQDLLLAFNLGPYWSDQRINCDADELEAKECLAVDGETILTLTKVKDGNAMATKALDPSIRPPSNFDARSNPFTVNGGGGLRLNPGGDLLTAYWMARDLSKKEAGERNISPFARDHMPVGGEAVPDGDVDEVDGDTEDEASADGDVTDGDDSESVTSDGDDTDGDTAENPDEGDGGGSCQSADRADGIVLLLLVTLLFWQRKRAGMPQPSIGS